MSQYEELAKKAVEWTESSNAYGKECKAFAVWIAVQLDEYFEVPRGKINFFQLDSDLTPTTVYKPLQAPEMIESHDGLQYFGLSLKLEVAGHRDFLIEQFPIGVQKTSTQWNIDVYGKRYEVPFSNLNSIRAMFDSFTTMLVEQYAAPMTTKRKTIGFIAS